MTGAWLTPEEKASRAASFGAAASHYQQFRPGPPADAVDWILDGRRGRVVDLGAGTGALTRILMDRVAETIAVEPDDRMRSVLLDQLPGARALKGRGESIPLPDGYADAVVASTSWHWMELLPTLREVARVLVPGGTLAVLWSGPDPDGEFLSAAQSVLNERMDRDLDKDGDESAGKASGLIRDALQRQQHFSLEIPEGEPFAQPERKDFGWSLPLSADQLVGLLGTFSWVISLSEEERSQIFDGARRLLREFLGVQGDVTVDLEFRSEGWRTRLLG